MIKNKDHLQLRIIERLDLLLLFSFFSIILAPFSLGLGVHPALSASSSLVSGLLHLALMGIIIYSKEDVIPYAKSLNNGKMVLYLLLFKSLLAFVLSWNLFFVMEFGLSLLYLFQLYQVQLKIKTLCIRNQVLFC